MFDLKLRTTSVINLKMKLQIRILGIDRNGLSELCLTFIVVNS